jgi:hypothetical protein
MAHDLKTIHISDDSDIAPILKQADGRPVRLEKGGVTYRLSRQSASVTASYDPAAVRRAVRAAAGSLTPEEGEALKAYIYKAREEGSRPADRP